MPQVSKHLCIVALGADRERLSVDLINAVTRRGCTIADCRIATLGQHFSAVLMLSGNWSAIARLETALPGLAEHLQLLIRHDHTREMPLQVDYRPYSAEIIAPQQARLLGALLDFFIGQHVHVIDANAQAYQSGLTGGHMCTVHLALNVPMTLYPQTLRDSFMDLCDDLHADGLLDPVKT